MGGAPGTHWPPLPPGLENQSRPSVCGVVGLLGDVAGDRQRAEAAPGRVAEHLVAVADALLGHERALAVLAGVDDEVGAAEQAGDLLPVVDLGAGPVEVGRVQEEALRLGDARGAQPRGHLAVLDGVGGAGVEVDDDVRVRLQRRDRVPELGLADGQLAVREAGRGDERVELEEEDDVVVADPLGHLVHEVLVAGGHRRRGGVAAVVVDQRVGREHHRGAGLLDLGALEVVRDLAGDVGAHVPHVEAVGAGLGGDLAQQRRHGRVGVAVLGLGLGGPAVGVDVELGAGERVAAAAAATAGCRRSDAQRVGGVAGLDRVVVEDRDQRVVVGADAVRPRAVEVGERAGPGSRSSPGR